MTESDPFDGDDKAAQDSMRLPEGKTCGDCKYFGRCKWLLSQEPTETTCDWAPSRFQAKATQCCDRDRDGDGNCDRHRDVSDPHARVAT